MTLIQKLIKIQWNREDLVLKTNPSIWITDTTRTVEYYRGTLAKTGLTLSIIVPDDIDLAIRLRGTGSSQEYRLPADETTCDICMYSELKDPRKTNDGVDWQWAMRNNG